MPGKAKGPRTVIADAMVVTGKSDGVTPAGEPRTDVVFRSENDEGLEPTTLVTLNVAAEVGAKFTAGSRYRIEVRERPGPDASE